MSAGPRDRRDRLHRRTTWPPTCSPTAGRCARWCARRAWPPGAGPRAPSRSPATCATRDAHGSARRGLRRRLPRRRALLPAPQRGARGGAHQRRRAPRTPWPRPRPPARARAHLVGVDDRHPRRRAASATRTPRSTRRQVIGAYKRSKVAVGADGGRGGPRGHVGGDRQPVAPRSGPGDWKPTPTGRVVLDFLRGRMRALRRHRPQPGRRARRGRRPPPGPRARAPGAPVHPRQREHDARARSCGRWPTITGLPAPRAAHPPRRGHRRRGRSTSWWRGGSCAASRWRRSTARAWRASAMFYSRGPRGDGARAPAVAGARRAARRRGLVLRGRHGGAAARASPGP